MSANLKAECQTSLIDIIATKYKCNSGMEGGESLKKMIMVITAIVAIVGITVTLVCMPANKLQ